VTTDPTNPPASGPRHAIEFPEELPVAARRFEIARAIHDHQVVIIAGETGSGKTTQIPKICLAMGRGVDGLIGCTQPRRIAATSVAARVAKELNVNLGDEVGYEIRFQRLVKASTFVKFMTDGILLAEVQGDPLLRSYDTLIIDEAHERSLNIDFLLGHLRQILPRRPDLKIVVCSATLETARFSSFFGDAPVIQVSGRTYPVDVLYRPPTDDENDLAETIANTVEEITSLDKRGDILIFLPGEREISETMDELSGRSLPHTVLLPLYARLAGAEQQRVFQSLPQRRIVLATNVAETSLTIPGIVYVIDPGYARINRYTPRTGVTQLQIEAISRASADQRKGRCGRVQSGICFRLYSESDYTLRPEYTDPELKRSGLAGVILRMKAQRLGDIESFPFLDPPAKRAIDEGYRVLEELGALGEKGELTPIGEQLARFPLDPRLGRMILGGRDQGALREVLIIAAGLTVQDPRERPLAAQQKADDSHRKFRNESSDFVGILRLWEFYQQARGRGPQAQLRKAWRDNFLSFLRLKEWSDVHEQLCGIVRELNFKPNEAPATDEQIHRALLPGLLSRIGMWHPEQRVFLGARQIRFQLHPGSGLAKKPPAWVMAAELVETTQLFARGAAKIEPTWLEEAGGALCKRSHGDPHWEQKPAQVMAREQVTLYGLPIVRDRKVHYGPIDPVTSRRLFIEHALVRQEYRSQGAFMEHNQRLLAAAQRLRDRARRSDLVADDQALCLFFEKRLGDEVHSGKLFESWRKLAESADPAVLHLSLDDILLDEAHELTPERYPDSLTLYGATLPLEYKFDPREDDDGLTITLPVVLLPQIDPGVFDWTIPGWLVEKVALLLDSLPKQLRKAIGPDKAAARALEPSLRPFNGPFLPALEAQIFEQFGARVPPEAWRLDELPEYLGFLFRVVDEHGKLLAASRDLRALQEKFAYLARQAWANVPKERWTRDGLRSFDLDVLPESVPIEAAGRRQILAYPALIDQGDSVQLRLLEAPAAAAEATRSGLRRLFLLQLRVSMSQLEQQVPAALATGPLGMLPKGGVSLRAQIATRALDEAFGLVNPATYPRDKKTFQTRFDANKRRVGEIIAALGRAGIEIGTEFQKVAAALKAAASKPGARKPALDDLAVQLAHLVPSDLFARYDEERLRHIPRYLKAIGVRLSRLPNDPLKDADKATQVLPHWQNYLKHRDAIVQRGRGLADLDEYRWLIEELRVAVFALERKAAVPVSAQRLDEVWARVKAS
jgi:ATP-dependent helicase HrpA